ncbi:MAG: signal peptidase I [Candidatus Bathyarchaeia archaeon]
MNHNLKKLWSNEYVQTAVVIGLVALLIFGFWYGLQIALNTPYPALAVVSGSMCVSYDGACDGWSHPFSPTLHIGDLIIVQGVNPQELSADYPNSDIIVFKKPSNPDELIVHRIVAVDEINGTLYFRTKGDGNSHVKWPEIPSPSDYDPWGTNGVPGIREDYVVGKVVMRIPWIGHIVLFMRNSIGLPIIAALIVIIIFVEFILPLLKGKKQKEGQLQT